MYIFFIKKYNMSITQRKYPETTMEEKKAVVAQEVRKGMFIAHKAQWISEQERGTIYALIQSNKNLLDRVSELTSMLEEVLGKSK